MRVVRGVRGTPYAPSCTVDGYVDLSSVCCDRSNFPSIEGFMSSHLWMSVFYRKIELLQWYIRRVLYKKELKAPGA